MSKYICKNYGSCQKADSRESIELPPGAEPICDECGFKLEPVEDDSARIPSRKKLLVGGFALAVLIAGASGYFWLGSSTSKRLAREAVAAVGPQKSDAQATGLPPDDKVLSEQKKEADAKIIAGGGAGASATQNSVIAKEFVKAAIPMMQAGKWREAEEQLMKAKQENPDEPLVYYNLAIVKLKQSQDKEAMANVEVALKKGFRDLPALESDADLKPLTSKPEYSALAGRYKTK